MIEITAVCDQPSILGPLIGGANVEHYSAQSNSRTGHFDRDIDRFFRSFWGRSPWDLVEGGEQAQAIEPSVNVYEDGDNLVVEAQVPGLKKEDIKIDLAGDRLTIRGQTRQEQEKKDRNYVIREMRYGAFERMVPLPYEVQSDKAQAELKDGVLRVVLPKSESVKKQARHIEVKAA